LVSLAFSTQAETPEKEETEGQGSENESMSAFVQTAAVQEPFGKTSIEQVLAS
jgi:hypothetical protein